MSAISPAISAYINKLVAYTEGKDPLVIMREAPQQLAALVKGASAEQLRTPPAPGKWTITQIVAHLSETEMASGWRYRQILEHSGSTLIAYEQDLWAEWSDYASCDPHESLELFRLERKSNLRLLERLQPEKWDYYAVHQERGRITLREIVRQIAGHDVNHIEQVRAILKK